MPKPLIVVTGKNGQLGWEITQLSATLASQYQFKFVDVDELDLSNPASIPDFFTHYQPQYFIHCAAYTQVDKAETEQELVLSINATSVGVLAEECAKLDCLFITISTDYVFDGNGKSPYLPYQETSPVNYYGKTKEIGEQLALKNNPKTIIIRTSWVYSTHGNNFVKTMLRLMAQRPELKVVADQVGCPTYAADLASAILHIIAQVANGNDQFGIYQYSNTGIISWYDFAVAIKEAAVLPCNVLPIPTTDYPTPAKRPAYSAMDLSSIEAAFGVVLHPWQERLNRVVTLLQSN